LSHQTCDLKKEVQTVDGVAALETPKEVPATADAELGVPLGKENHRFVRKKTT